VLPILNGLINEIVLKNALLEAGIGLLSGEAVIRLVKHGPFMRGCIGLLLHRYHRR
jgi:hypothetical protein